MIGLFAVLVVAEENEDGTKSVVLTMDQSFDSGKSFSNRGSITIHSLRSGAVSIQQNDLTESEKDAIVSLCHDDGLYLIRAVSNGDTISSFRSATHACNLIETGLSDLFTIQLDWRYVLKNVYVSFSNFIMYIIFFLLLAIKLLPCTCQHRVIRAKFQ